jgi:hypothetical protein
MLFGIDYIGGANYAEVIHRHHPEGYAAGFLLKTMGQKEEWPNAIDAVGALCEKGTAPEMRISGLWLDGHMFQKEHIKIAVNQARRVANLVENYPAIRFFYQPWLEPLWTSTELMRKCKKRCRKVLPKQVKIIGAPSSPKGWHEVHGTSMKTYANKYIYSWDGSDMKNVSASKRYHRDAHIYFACVPQCNGKSDWDESTPRVERTHWLRKQHIDWMVNELKGD